MTGVSWRIRASHIYLKFGLNMKGVDKPVGLGPICGVWLSPFLFINRLMIGPSSRMFETTMSIRLYML